MRSTSQTLAAPSCANFCATSAPFSWDITRSTLASTIWPTVTQGSPEARARTFWAMVAPDIVLLHVSIHGRRYMKQSPPPAATASEARSDAQRGRPEPALVIGGIGLEVAHLGGVELASDRQVVTVDGHEQPTAGLQQRSKMGRSQQRREIAHGRTSHLEGTAVLSDQLVEGYHGEGVGGHDDRAVGGAAEQQHGLESQPLVLLLEHQGQVAAGLGDRRT